MRVGVGWGVELECSGPGNGEEGPTESILLA